MSAIKDFFKKKKADAKFKLAGSGQKLGDATTASSKNVARPVAGSSRERQHPSQSAQQAGAAALNRINSEQQQDFQRNRQKALIKEQARRELEAEQEVDVEVARLKDVYGEKVVEEREGPSQLEGVYYRCSLIGEERYTKDVMKEKIKEFLYSQLEQERTLTAALIIYSCNSPKEKVTVCVETLCKYIDNILKNPGEAKYRKIRMSNKAFQERVASLEGVNDFLIGCGFEMKNIPGPDGGEEMYWVYSAEVDQEHFTSLKDTLLTAEPVTAELDRDTTVFSPTCVVAPPALPPSFFSITKEEIKREQQIRSEDVERENMLRTKAMRQKEEIKARRKYKFCLIRVRFPDNSIIQGTFSVYESISCVMDWVTDCLDTPLPFQLSDSVTGSVLSDHELVLVDLGLVPTAVLVFSWDQEIAAELQAAGAMPAFLKADLLAGAR